MSVRILIIFVWLMACAPCYAQISPKEGSKLNHTQVMLEYERVKGAAIYLIQLAEDSPGSSFEHYLMEQKDSSTATMVRVLEFGKKYKWRYAGISKGQSPVWKGPYHFEIETGTMQKLGLLSLAVTTNDPSAHAGGLIVTDGIYAIIDRSGKPVWSLPKINWRFNTTRATVVTDSSVDQIMKIDIRPYIYDIRLTPYGTITYVTDTSIVECDLNGNIVWEKYDRESPSDIGEDNYNHVLLHMPNGHYMTLGQIQWRKASDYADTNCTKHMAKKTFNNTEYVKVDFGTVLEYDEKGKLVWSWSSQDYFDKDALADPEANADLRTRVNAFSIDRANRFVYVGFRDVSRIVKVEKSTGKVVDSWGAPAKWGADPIHRLNIHQQHDASILDDSLILIFNNNDRPGADSIPSVIAFSPQDGKSGKIEWEYDFKPDASMRHKDRTGGNADLLKNGNYLVCGGTLNTIFEVTKGKKIVWQAKFKAKEIPGYQYYYRVYRAHYVSSLYPCYFTMQTDRDTVTKESASFNIKLYNEGSESDSYEIRISSESGRIGEPISSQTVAAGGSETIRVEAVTQLTKAQNLEISIRSKTNPHLERKTLMWYAN